MTKTTFDDKSFGVERVDYKDKLIRELEEMLESLKKVN
jgi:hypothetical protein